MRAFCEDCQAAQRVSETGIPIPSNPRATYKQFDLHKPPTKQEVCDGSGKRV